MVVQRVFKAAFPIMSPKWHAPLAKVLKAKTERATGHNPALEFRTVHQNIKDSGSSSRGSVVSEPWGWGFDPWPWLGGKKSLWRGLYPSFFMHMKLFLQLYKTSPQSKLFSSCCLHFYIKVSFHSAAVSPLQESPSIGGTYEVAVTAVRPPGPENLPICSLEVSRRLVCNAIFWIMHKSLQTHDMLWELPVSVWFQRNVECSPWWAVSVHRGRAMYTTPSHTPACHKFCGL